MLLLLTFAVYATQCLANPAAFHAKYRQQHGQANPRSIESSQARNESGFRFLSAATQRESASQSTRRIHGGD
jgi:hypothetical protein